MRVTLSLLLLVSIGCSRGPAGTRVFGTITFKGQPVPAGRIYFDPDSAKQNSGQQGVATIEGGKYDTSKNGQSPSPGPVVVRIQGFGPTVDGVPGPLLFASHEVRMDVGTQPMDKDFDVPSTAGVKKSSVTGP